MTRNVLWSRASVCLSVCLSAAACLHYYTDPNVTWRSDSGCPLVVHYFADLQSVHGLRRYGNITRTRNVSKYMLVLALCLVFYYRTQCTALGSVLATSVTSFLILVFVCHSNISGTAERISAKFTGKTCLVPCSEEFECQGQRSKVKVTRHKNALCTPITPGSDGMERARCKWRHAAVDGTIASLPGVTSGACVCGLCLVKHL